MLSGATQRAAAPRWSAGQYLPLGKEELVSVDHPPLLGRRDRATQDLMSFVSRSSRMALPRSARLRVRVCHDERSLVGNCHQLSSALVMRRWVPIRSATLLFLLEF